MRAVQVVAKFGRGVTLRVVVKGVEDGRRRVVGWAHIFKCFATCLISFY